MDLHQQLVEQGNDASEAHHAPDGGHIDGGLGGRDELETEQGQPDGEAQADSEEDTDCGLQVTGEFVRQARVEDIHDDSTANNESPNVAGVFLDGVLQQTIL